MHRYEGAFPCTPATNTTPAVLLGNGSSLGGLCKTSACVGGHVPFCLGRLCWCLCRLLVGRNEPTGGYYCAGALEGMGCYGRLGSDRMASYNAIFKCFPADGDSGRDVLYLLLISAVYLPDSRV